MHIVIFGLTISSSWGNGHATLWRSLVKAMLRRGHSVTFYERIVPYYAQERDLDSLPAGGRLRLYDDFEEIRYEAAREMSHTDLALSTSYCADGPAAAELILASGSGIRAFYDLDTPVTLDGLQQRRPVEYLPAQGLSDFDLVLSFTGGRALDELRSRLGARNVAPLYGSVDPDEHRPTMPRDEFRAALSYLGTYAPDRQEALERLFLGAAHQQPNDRFLIGGAQYPESFPWLPNVAFVRHVPPPMHSDFFSSCRATLNLTRGVMARYGYCPSGRLFEAAACGAPILSDSWEGLDTFFMPGKELLCVDTAEDVSAALERSDEELQRMATLARERTLAEHTGDCRVRELEQICAAVMQTTAAEA
ncbi:MAG TPA: glycosyltransferase [Acidobacteriaceae bacterium]